jgi:hypothetical protein
MRTRCSGQPFGLSADLGSDDHSKLGHGLITDLLVRDEQVHQSYLARHFSAFGAWRLNNLTPQTPGAPEFHFLAQQVRGQKQGLGMIYGAIQQQAAMLAFNDTYRLLTMIAILMIPSFLLFRGGKPISASTPAH